ncbi:hypothetical protein MNBD_NITROSPINAE04-545, partial [hydrothermal vent metagenome]
PGPIKPSAIKKKKKDFFKNLVDGKIETPSELAFREFLADRFDQDEWLKKIGVIFNEEH